MRLSAKLRPIFCGSLIVFAILAGPAMGQGLFAKGQGWFDLARYEELKKSNRPMLEFVLAAMYESIFYAQGSIGRPVICATPIPIAGPRLIELIDQEVQKPTNPMRPTYANNDHVAFVLMNALKTAGACK